MVKTLKRPTGQQTQITGTVAAQYSLCFLSNVVGKNEFLNLLF